MTVAMPAPAPAEMADFPAEDAGAAPVSSAVPPVLELLPPEGALGHPSSRIQALARQTVPEAVSGHDAGPETGGRALT